MPYSITVSQTRIYPGTTHFYFTVNVKTGHDLLNYECQTNGHDLVSYQSQHGHDLVNYQCRTNGHDLINSFVQTRINYSITVIKAESIPIEYILDSRF